MLFSIIKFYLYSPNLTSLIQPRIDRKIFAFQLSKRLETNRYRFTNIFIYFLANLILDAYLYCESSRFPSVICIFIVSDLPYLPYDAVTCSAKRGARLARLKEEEEEELRKTQ